MLPTFSYGFDHPHGFCIENGSLLSGFPLTSFSALNSIRVYQRGSNSTNGGVIVMKCGAMNVKYNVNGRFT